MTLVFHRIERKLVSWLDKRLSFFWISTLLLLIALGTTIVGDIWGTTISGIAWLKIASSTSTWLFTYLGLLLAVYSIKGLSDRPGNINEVLLKAADLLEEAPVSNRVVTLLCEYPGWGALTERTTTAYRRFVSVWENVLKEECNTRVVLVSPTLAGMEKYIRKYAKDYHSEDEIQAAIKSNRRMCNEMLNPT